MEKKEEKGKRGGRREMRKKELGENKFVKTRNAVVLRNC